MNYKSNKIFTKCCASILAVSNIFSGVSATPEEKPKKAEDNQLSISKNEFLVSILLASGFATLATLLSSKKIFSANSTPLCINNEEDCSEMVESMALALEHTVPTKSFSNNCSRRECAESSYSGEKLNQQEDICIDEDCACGASSCSRETPDKQGNTYIDKDFLIRECGASSYSDLLNQKDISVIVNGEEYKYVMSSIENPSGTGTQKGNLSKKLSGCLYGVYGKSGTKKVDGFKDSGWDYKLPFVIHLTAYSSNKTRVCRKHTAVKLKSDGNCQMIKCLSHGGLSTDINISKLYPDNSSDKALIVVGYWQKQTS